MLRSLSDVCKFFLQVNVENLYEIIQRYDKEKLFQIIDFVIWETKYTNKTYLLYTFGLMYFMNLNLRDEVSV